jgi:hypothetical protein
VSAVGTPDRLKATLISRLIRSEAAVQYAAKRSLTNTITWVDIADAASVVAAANATAVGVAAMIVAVAVL